MEKNVEAEETTMMMEDSKPNSNLADNGEVFFY